MPFESVILTIRFPSGETEFATREFLPAVGEVLHRRGKSWIVERVDEEAGKRIVGLAPALDGQPGVA